jgi:fatty-acyl-CoA synthase/long-chain acyl-CoA synthetase
MSPAVCRQICALPDEVKSRYDLSTIRAVYAGAAKWTYAVKLMYRETFPENTLWEIYGSTELASNTVMSPDDHWGRPESCGKPVVGVEIVLRGEDDEIVTTPHQRGVLYVKSDYAAGFLGYENEPEATAAALWGEYRTVGDVAYFDDEGFFYICDRTKDMIVSGGVNLFPQEIEAVIDSHPDVLECAVFGVPDEVWGESVHAVVVVRPGRHLDDVAISSYCRQHLSSEKVPKSVSFMDELPHTLSGKVLKRQLREKFWADSGRLI